MSSEINAVELVNVYKTFKSNETTVEALKNVNLRVKDGEFLVIAGKRLREDNAVESNLWTPSARQRKGISSWN